MAQRHQQSSSKYGHSRSTGPSPRSTRMRTQAVRNASETETNIYSPNPYSARGPMPPNQPYVPSAPTKHQPIQGPGEFVPLQQNHYHAGVTNAHHPQHSYGNPRAHSQTPSTTQSSHGQSTSTNFEGLYSFGAYKIVDLAIVEFPPRPNEAIKYGFIYKKEVSWWKIFTDYMEGRDGMTVHPEITDEWYWYVHRTVKPEMEFHESLERRTYPLSYHSK